MTDDADEPEYVVGLSWRVGRDVSDAALDRFAGLLGPWRPCAWTEGGVLHTTIGIDAASYDAAARAGLRTLEDAFAAAGLSGSALELSVVTEQGQARYVPDALR
ncbi:hypothetical protein [Motilibacter deserti]|uniref:Uncharacterized protein n=1 Tax=Motilibacter deserti TaxID=2714956 RepID=A0ABX0GZX6_9ACTN|nr:hypothetical protein [Motilibacter deserti]NHC16150.1 hypothetical protein [Motilibacter deserti]